MPSLRSVLGLMLCLVAALIGPRASAQTIVTGAVQNASLPVWFVTLDGPKNIGGGTVEGTLPISAVLIATNGGAITLSNVLTAGSYRVTLGRSGKDWFPIVVPDDPGPFNWTALATNLNQLTNHFPLMTGATAGTAGAAGLVPAPSAGDEGKFLKGDGTWGTATGGGSTVTNLADIGDVALSSPIANQKLVYDGTNWVNATDTGGGNTFDQDNATTFTFDAQ